MMNKIININRKIFEIMNAELRKEEKGKENRRSSMNVEVGS